jgi:hypothetical protein
MNSSNYDYAKLRELADSGEPAEALCSATGVDLAFASRYLINRRYRKAFVKRFPGRTADRNRERRFGVTVEDYNSRVKNQSNVCAVCGRSETSSYRGKLRRLAVDHCHSTGAVRDLLCTKCNMVLGAVGDDIGVLRQMIAYLERHNHSTQPED